MGRGGARIGAGRKPKIRTELQVIDGGMSAAETPAARDAGVSSIAPEDLPLAAREFWQTHAGLAIEARTLTPRTVPGFRWLCERASEFRLLQQTIDRDGPTYLKVTVDGAGQEHQEIKAHPLTVAKDRAWKDVDAGLARFCLTGVGKPVVGERKSQGDQQKAALRAKFFGGARA